MDFTPQEIDRYARHLTLPEVGRPGQEKLKNARVLVVGAGGLGSPVALYLAAAGVGHLTIMDPDVVSVSNLQRQILFSSSAVDRGKAKEAETRLRDLNPEIEIEGVSERISAENAREHIRGFDVVVDGSDNFATRYAINDACVLEQKPLVYGAVFRFEAQLSVFGFEGGPCYRCLYPEAPPLEAVPNCAETGVLGVLPGTVGTLMAAEVLKLILGIGRPLSGTLLTYQALSAEFQKLSIARRGDCQEHVGRAVQATAEEGLSAKDFLALVQSGEASFIDVRSEGEFTSGSVADAVNLPLSQLVQSEIPSGPLVVFCQSGKRSARAVEIIKSRGLTQVRHLSGGLNSL